MNILSVIGTLMSLVALALAIAQGTLHKFVEVFIPTDVSNPDDPELSCSIAGLGIFTTVYDSSCLDPAVLASSRVPSEKFTSPTTEFKLLFPAQENFVAEVLPINTELLGTFDALFGAAPGQGFATAALGAQVAAIANTEFETCSQYMTDIDANMLALFAPLNTALLPLIVPLIINDTVTDLKTAVSSIDASLGAPAVSGLNALQGLDVATWVGLSAGLEAFCGLSSDLTATFNATDAVCIKTVYDNVAGTFLASSPATFAFLSGLGTLFSSCAAAPGLNTPQNCLGGSISTQITNSEIFIPATFAAGPPFGTFCSVTSICGSGSKAAIAGAAATAAAPLLASVDLTALSPTELVLFASVSTAVQGLGAYALVMNFLAGPVFTATATIATATAADVIALLDSTLVIPTFPATQTEFYTPCAILQIGAQALASEGFSSDFIGSTPGACGFNVFFPGAAEVAAFTQNPLADLIGALGELYAQCAIPLFALAPTECHLLFPSIFISGAYSFDLNVTAFSKTTPDAVFVEGIAACEDDATDLEKIKLAQVLFIVCLATFSLSVFAGIASLALPKIQALISVLAGLLVVLALSTNLGALLAVRSAPVYDAVAEEPEVDKPFYKEGIVVLLALVTIIVSALTAALYFGAAFAAVKGKCGAGKSEGEEEIKASLATTMAKEDPEAKPSI